MLFFRAGRSLTVTMKVASSASFVRRRGSCRRVVGNALIMTALLAGLHVAVTFIITPATAVGESSRRSAALLGTGLLVAAPGAAQAGEATKTFEPTKQYTVADTYTIKFPPEWPVIQKNREG